MLCVHSWFAAVVGRGYELYLYVIMDGHTVGHVAQPCYVGVHILSARRLVVFGVVVHDRLSEIDSCSISAAQVKMTFI